METANCLFQVFKTINNNYLYDTNRNQIVVISESTYHTLQKVSEGKISFDSISESSNEIKELKKKGFLSNKHVHEIEHSNSKYLSTLLERRLQKVTLQLTQNCNFRCTYCHYTCNDGGQRVHSSKRMPLEMAKKAILFLRDHSIDIPEVYVGFYGGEPLLEFSMIEKIVEFIKVELAGKIVHYTLTTNSVLMDDRMIKFFIENDVSIVISLDGPKEINDKHRVFASSSQSTFEAIIQKLKYIYQNYPKFFKQTTVNMVMDPSNDFDQIDQLFRDYPFLKKCNISASTIDDVGATEKNVYTEEFTSKLQYHDFLTYLYIFNRFPDKLRSPIFSSQTSAIRKDLDSLTARENLPNKDAPGGPCVPGEVRLMVTVDGNFVICERVSEISDPMIIGNIDTGIQIEKALKLLNVAQITADQCKNCWVFSNCTLCAKYADVNGSLSASERLKYCQKAQHDACRMLRRKALIQEAAEIYHQSVII